MASKKLLKNTLSQNAHLQVNKRLIHTLGLTEAALVSLLIDSENMHADDSGWFFLTAEMAQHELNIGRKPYDAAIKAINDAGLMQTTLRGLPAKKYFRLNHDEIVALLSDEDDDEYKQNCPEGSNKIDQNGQTCMFKMDSNKESTNNKKEESKKENNKVKENSKKKEFDLSFVNIEFEDVFNEWLDYKRSKNQMYKRQIDVEIAYRKLLEYSCNDPKIAQEIIESAILGNYMGFFAPKKQNNYGNSSNETPSLAKQFAANLKATGSIFGRG